MMQWEASLTGAGVTVYVDGTPYALVDTAERRGSSLCPPYVLVHGEHPPAMHLGKEDQGVTAWWVSHLRVEWDAPAIDPDATTPGSARIWRRK